MRLRPGIGAVESIISSATTILEDLPPSIRRDEIRLMDAGDTIPLRIIDGIVAQVPAKQVRRRGRLAYPLVLILYDDRFGRRKSPTMPDGVEAHEASYAILWRFADEEEDTLYNKEKRFGILVCVELLRLVNAGHGSVLFEKNASCRPEFYPLI